MGLIKFKYENGDKVKETVTGFTGVITGSVKYLTGCNQYLVVPRCKDKSKPVKSTWYDEGRLSLLQSKEVLAEEVIEDVKDSGPDKQAPNKG